MLYRVVKWVILYEYVGNGGEWVYKGSGLRIVCDKWENGYRSWICQKP